jgi:hypothetical protein
MLQVELEPDPTHCIETAAKREYEEILRKLLTPERESAELRAKAELLRAFLESTDFKNLRRESEKHLIEGRKVKFVVYSEEGLPKYDMLVK